MGSRPRGSPAERAPWSNRSGIWQTGRVLSSCEARALKRDGCAPARRSDEAAPRAASILLAALSSILVTIGLSIATSAVASAATVWSPPTQIAAPSPPLSGSLTRVSCVDPTDCTAVGADNNQQPFYVTESDGVWGTPTQLAWPLGSGSFSGVSCPRRQLHRGGLGRKRPGLHDRAPLCHGDGRHVGSRH